MRVSCSIELTNDEMKDGKETTHLYYFRRDGPNRRDCSSLLQRRIGRRRCPRQSRTSIVLPSFLPFPSVLVVLQISQGEEAMSDNERHVEEHYPMWHDSNQKRWTDAGGTRWLRHERGRSDFRVLINQDIDCRLHLFSFKLNCMCYNIVDCGKENGERCCDKNIGRNILEEKEERGKKMRSKKKNEKEKERIWGWEGIKKERKREESEENKNQRATRKIGKK